MIDMKIHRRAFLGGTAALALTGIAPLRAMAEGEAIRIGALTPLTGSGGTYGPVMVKAIQAVAAEINAAGGILGRKVEIISEDDQTNRKPAYVPPASSWMWTRSRRSSAPGHRRSQPPSHRSAGNPRPCC